MSTATIECDSPSQYAGNWTASLSILRMGCILELETRPEYGIAEEIPAPLLLALGHIPCPRVYRGSFLHPTHWKSNNTSSRDGALMQETGQQIRANVHTCADRGTL